MPEQARVSLQGPTRVGVISPQQADSTGLEHASNIIPTQINQSAYDILSTNQLMCIQSLAFQAAMFLAGGAC